VRATRTVVRPGRKRGGTTLVFRLSRRATLRITIVRVYPSCRRIGAFTVRARPGMNRIRFRGEVRGRPLPAGGYRLMVRSRGARRDAAAVPIVIVDGETSTAELRKARRTTVCGDPVADVVPEATEPEPATATVGGRDDKGSRGAAVAPSRTRIKAPLAGAAGAIEQGAKKLAKGLKHAAKDNAFDDPFVLTIVALMVLSSAVLGAIVLGHVARTMGIRQRVFPE
jgi:hypothetical protein